MTGDEVEAQSRAAYVINGRTENVSNYNVPLKVRQDFSGFYDNSVRIEELENKLYYIEAWVLARLSVVTV